MTDERKQCLAKVLVKLSELKLFKTTLKLDDQVQFVWAEGLLKAYEFQHVVQAIEQMKHSDNEWVNFGTIATEARRIAAANSREYRPFANPKRLTISQLRKVAAGNEVHQKVSNDKARRLK